MWFSRRVVVNILLSAWWVVGCTQWPQSGSVLQIWLLRILVPGCSWRTSRAHGKTMTEWSWQQQVTSDHIPVRYSHATANYKCKDTRFANCCVVVFGGYNHKNGKATWLNDLWEINMKTMEFREVRNENNPVARYSASLTQTKSSIAILFGGNDGGLRFQTSKSPGSYVFGSYMNDLWVLKDFEWTQIVRKHETKQHSSWPHPRSGHTGTYFPSDDSIVVFGGLTAPFGVNNKTFVTNEVWRYDIKGSKWFDDSIDSRSTAKRPLPRYGHSAVGLSGKLYIFGGTHKMGTLKCKLRFSCSKSLKDLWAYDYIEKRWTNIRTASSPQPLTHATLAPMYDTTILLFGGANCKPACKCSNELWQFDIESEVWKKIAVTQKKDSRSVPVHRYRHSFTYVAGLNTYVLFGGESYAPSLYFNDIWTLTEIDAETGLAVSSSVSDRVAVSLRSFQIVAFLFALAVLLCSLCRGSRFRACMRKRWYCVPRRFTD